ncbi:ribonuclease E [Herbaspirillum sp. Sphag1AN]|uniref:Rne/Rng family ribonuclease n=1 Tax=unclassified Herbaspirillum TaxID=2624150 RepID=UPI0016151B33|nr:MULTISPECIES: Rne/Rng family ribonuclease [unclassified Herbaspirillum]MBB3210866.1 ribonuclease E [Herbaspirillum sp. Sphag1AN]MBB3244496.1 ribonuclease E [Herbaspirillum sp. Sphag64]
MKRMLFNATQQEELRVAIVDGQKLIDIDIEATGREQRKSNIYKGVITRIEPSLEACFVNYGEERHGFLPFKEVARTYFKEGIDVRNASIKEALREGQEIIVQVEKEERGNKGAALTSFISLAGRYLVLMPNNPRGGGVSRRVEGEDRQELRETMDKLDLPTGMSVIARTAGIGRNVDELQWDLNYLMQLWRAIDGAGQSGSGAFLIYQESSLVIRAIRDYFQPDIGEILIDTDDIHEQAQQFMAHVMPDMVHRVKRYRDDVPLFSRFQIEHQIETAYSRTVPLPSGGAIVIDHTEALVSVDVNSARATRGSDIETTAFYTNLEAADEVARQLRLRDLGGLIVIDFIDMENAKNQREVESRLKDALHHDRARVQMGKISRFGLMELSRQRLRPSLSEGSHVTCPRCNGTGHIRDTESSALQVLRIIQEEAMKENSAAIHVQAPVDVAAFLLNEKRGEILKIETRHRVTIIMIPNKHLETPHYKLERIKHDDPRLDDTQASYTMAEQAETDISYSKRHKEEVKPRQEAVVKGITPDQPAPIVERKVAAEPVPTLAPEAGLLGKIWSFFRKKPVEPVVVAAPVEAKGPQKRDPADRNNRNRNGRNRNGGGNGRGRNEREERDGTAQQANGGREDGNKQEVEAKQPRQPRQPREAREPREDRNEAREPREAKEVREPRPPREPREPRQPRPPREERKEQVKAEEQLPLDAVAVPLNIEGTEAAQVTGNQVDGAEDGAEPRRRRRRGGRNRNRRDRDGAENPNAQSADAAEGEVSGSEAPAEHNEATESIAAAATVVAVTTEVQAAAVTAPVVAAVATAVEAPVVAAPEVAVTPVASVAVSAPAAPVAPVAPAQEQISLLPEAAPVAEAAIPVPAPVAAPAVVAEAPLAQPAVEAVVPVTATETPAVAAAAVATPMEAPAVPVAAPVAAQAGTPAAAPADVPKAASKMAADLDAVLAAAGLVLANTDPSKLRAAQEAAAQIVVPARVPRERKPLPPQSNEPLVQVETRR